MTFDEFRERNRLRQVKKCCASCRFGEVRWEGECKCHHPSLDDPDSIWNNTVTDEVCNKWAKVR